MGYAKKRTYYMAVDKKAGLPKLSFEEFFDYIYKNKEDCERYEITRANKNLKKIVKVRVEIA